MKALTNESIGLARFGTERLVRKLCHHVSWDNAYESAFNSVGIIVMKILKGRCRDCECRFEGIYQGNVCSVFCSVFSDKRIKGFSMNGMQQLHFFDVNDKWFATMQSFHKDIDGAAIILAGFGYMCKRYEIFA